MVNNIFYILAYKILMFFNKNSYVQDKMKIFFMTDIFEDDTLMKFICFVNMFSVWIAM